MTQLDRRYIFAFAPLALMAGLLCCSPSEIQAKCLPELVAKVAADNGCTEVEEFYRRPGMVEPPFLFGYRPDLAKHKSFMFWCQSKSATPRYKLIAHTNDGVRGSCDGVVRESDSFPGGLSLTEPVGDDLKGYRWSDGSIVKITPGTEVAVITSVYDGVGDSFFCFDGRWAGKAWD